MKTFSFAERNGNAVIIISAENEDEGREYLTEIVKYPDEFRCEEIDNNEDW